MTQSDRFGSNKIMTTALVAMVAFIGLVMVYSDRSPTGATQSSNPAAWDVSLAAGQLCGQCALASNRGLDIPAECGKLDDKGSPLFISTEQRGTYQCCRRACQTSEIVGAAGSMSFERCSSTCNRAADDVFTGRQRYSGNPFDIPASS